MTQKHLQFIDCLPCIVCGRTEESTHHHLLRVGREYLTPTKETEGLMFPKVKSKGMGTKSDDKFCLPVCPSCHAKAHRCGNDKEYFMKHEKESKTYIMSDENPNEEQEVVILNKYNLSVKLKNELQYLSDLY